MTSSEGGKEMPAEADPTAPGLKHGAPAIPLLDALEPELADVWSQPKLCLRELEDEDDRAMFDDLNRRYSHLGGKHREWVEFHEMHKSEGWFHYARLEDVPPHPRES